MMRFPLTLASLLERAGRYFTNIEIVERRPDRSIERSTIGKFYKRSRALAECLTKAGMARGDRVATMLWNHAVHLENYFGIPCAGGVVHPLNVRLHPDELVYIINHAGDRFLVIEETLWPLFLKIKDRVRFERVWIWRNCGGPVPDGARDYEQFLEGARGDYQYPNLDEHEAAAMCYTSGTTGRAKGVVYSHRSIVLHTFAELMPDAFGISQKDSVFVISPMFHVNGWGMPHCAVAAGSKLVFPGVHLDPESLLDLLASENVTVTGAVPTIWIAIRDMMEKYPNRWNWNHIVRAVVGGAAPPVELLKFFDGRGIRLMHAWGMTETSPIATFGSLKSYLLSAPEEDQYHARMLQGWSVPFVETRIVNDHDQELAWDGRIAGELQVRGPWVAASYYNYPEAAERWTGDGWFRTGDVASIDADGYIKITDRAKDLIKSGGEWISSVDLETTIMGHPAVKEAAVVAVPHPKWQERPLAIVVLRDGAAATSEELSLYLTKFFARWQIPDAFVFTAQIPRTSVGKFKKTELREQYKDWKW